MKKATTILTVILCIALGMQTTKAQSLDKWTELKEFHEVMASTFHPSEEGNYKPIRARSAEMAEKAQKLADSKIPKEFDNADVKKAVAKLAADSKSLDEKNKAGISNEELGKLLSALHDTFHQIVGL
jgi:hypothetical protein